MFFLGVSLVIICVNIFRTRFLKAPTHFSKPSSLGAFKGAKLYFLPALKELKHPLKGIMSPSAKHIAHSARRFSN
jgi:hypothetical protein